MESIQRTFESDSEEILSEEDLSFDESKDMYKVDSWPDDEDEPTGYKIRGKFLFWKAVEMMKLGLKKSKVSKKIHDYEFLVTDVRMIKHWTEADIDIVKNGKGGACVKFFGPNK